MRILLPFFLLLFFCASSLQSQQETKTFLLSKDEFKKFEGAGILITEAIKNAFGEPSKQNPYKLDIKQIDAWNNAVPEFKYYPAVPNDTKKSLLNTNVINAKVNTPIKLRITLNPANSILNEALKPYINKKNAFNLQIVIIGIENILVKETKSRVDFFSLIDEHAFADRSFKTFFGDQKKMNYGIAYDKLSACLVKNIFEPECAENIELLNSTNNDYMQFNNKITSSEYSSAYVLFDILVIRERSTFNPGIEKYLSKNKDGSEHLKFYYVIPKDNLRAKQKKIMDIEGKIVNINKLPQKDVTIYLRDNSKAIIGSQKTSENGTFKFEKLKEGSDYSLFIDAGGNSEKALFVTTKNDIMIAQFEKTASGFEYKLFDADITTLSGIEEIEPTIEFAGSIKGKMVKVTDKITPLAHEVIELKNSVNQVIQSQETDNEGNFEFLAINPKSEYLIEAPNYISGDKNEKVYLANSKVELVKQFKKNQNDKFVFKILPAEICQLQSMTEADIDLIFIKQKKLNPNEIIIQDFVYYNLNSFKISAESKPILDKIAKIAGENSLYKLEIISHTDSRGEIADNKKLSEKRSESVLSYLATKINDIQRLKSVGMGESKPLNGCTDGSSCIEAEYQMNRRTEFKFYK